MAPVIRECQRRGLDHFELHTGQHHSYEMDRVFSEQPELPSAEHNIVYPSEGENKFYKEMLVGNKSLGKGELEAISICKNGADMFS